jgi:putative addiction module CopG family antidote
MAKNTSFSLGDHFSEFVERKVAEGRYSSASDVVRAGLRLLEEDETKLEALRAAPSSKARKAGLRSHSILKTSSSASARRETAPLEFVHSQATGRNRP